jgi:hypothetical protein
MTISRNNTLGGILALTLGFTAITSTVNAKQNVIVKRDYNTVVVYKSPNPHLHKVVALKALAVKKRKARIIRRTIRAALR